MGSSISLLCASQTTSKKTRIKVLVNHWAQAKTEEKEPEAKADDDDGAEITTAIIDGIPRSSHELGGRERVGAQSHAV